MMAGADPRSVQQWLGPADLRTTLRYAHTSIEHERQAIELLSYHAGQIGNQARAS
jgi:site-specific recombinase XerD